MRIDDEGIRVHVGQHQLAYAVFSLVVAILGSWTALDLQRQVEAHRGRVRTYWLMATAVAMGLSIWTGDYIAMLGYDAGVPITYDLRMTIGSLLMAIGGTAFAFVAVQAKGPSRTKIMLGGLCMGASIALSNYLAMGAIQMPAFVRISPPVVIASFVVAVLLSSGALTTLARSPGSAMRVLAAVVLGGAMATMHYAALSAVSFQPIPVQVARDGIDQALLAVLVGSATTMLLVLGLMSAIFDRRLGAVELHKAKAVAESERHLRQIMTRMPLGIVAVSTDADNATLFTNPMAEEILGGRSPLSLPFLDPEGVALPARDNPFRRALAGESWPDRALMKIARSDGRTGFLEVSATRLHDGDVVGEIVFMITDATARMDAELALNQAQKLETIGQLTGGVAHDFNNLLTPIVGGLDMLRREKGMSPRAQRVIEGAMQASQRAATLVQRLLAFARRQTLQARPVDMKPLLEGLHDLIRRTIGPSITTSIEVPESVGVRVDPGQLELAILNLAVNSRDAMPEGGSLTISARITAVTGHEGLSLPIGEYVCVTVADDGTGMSESTLRRAIEPFFSTKGVGKGTGLGLSMAHGLAAQSNGELRITSAPGAGTRIDMFLPRIVVDTEDEVEAEAEMIEAGECVTVLVVDDEDLVRNATAEVLRDMGHEVLQASSGVQALGMLRGNADIRLVVSDHLMPGMTGAALATEMRTLAPAVPVLIITGYANPDELPRNLPYLAKPFRQRDLARMVGLALANGSAHDPALRSGGR